MKEILIFLLLCIVLILFIYFFRTSSLNEQYSKSLRNENHPKIDTRSKMDDRSEKINATAKILYKHEERKEQKERLIIF